MKPYTADVSVRSIRSLPVRGRGLKRVGGQSIIVRLAGRSPCGGAD